MGPAMLVVGTDDSTTMANIGRSMARSPSPSIDVAVRHPHCDGALNDTLSKQVFSGGGGRDVVGWPWALACDVSMSSAS